jgi:hypothetical protein
MKLTTRDNLKYPESPEGRTAFSSGRCPGGFSLPYDGVRNA